MEKERIEARINMELSGIKMCRKCNQNKKSSEFGNKAAAKDGLQSYCKACIAESKRNARIY